MKFFFDDGSALSLLSESIITTYTLDGFNSNMGLARDSLIGVIDITSDLLVISNKNEDSVDFDRVQYSVK